MYRQGDVLLIRCGDLPEGAEGAEARSVVLAEGKVTGHAHRVVGPMAELLDLSTPDVVGRLRLRLPAGGRLVHDEHRPIVLPAGEYEVRLQRTLTSAGLWEQVRD
jgi:hypothetical protein